MWTWTPSMPRWRFRTTRTQRQASGSGRHLRPLGGLRRLLEARKYGIHSPWHGQGPQALPRRGLSAGQDGRYHEVSEQIMAISTVSPRWWNRFPWTKPFRCHRFHGLFGEAPVIAREIKNISPRKPALLPSDRGRHLQTAGQIASDLQKPRWADCGRGRRGTCISGWTADQ